MDAHLDDSLNLDNSMGVEFERVVSDDTDMTLDDTEHSSVINMEFEEQPILMDTGGEEIVELMSDQLPLHDKSDFSISTENVIQEINVGNKQITTNKPEPMMEFQFDPQSLISPQIKQEVKILTGHTQFSFTEQTSSESATGLRQVAIAPKPPPLPIKASTRLAFTPAKHYATIAPKPGPKQVAVIGTRPPTVKKQPLSFRTTQIGRQVVMVPAALGGQKLKIVQTSTGMQTIMKVDSDQAQLFSAKGQLGGKPLVTKFVVPDKGELAKLSNQQAVLTKVVPANAAQTRYITIQQKNVSVNNPILITSSAKQLNTANIRLAKPKTTTAKILPGTITTTADGTKKVVISATQNVIIKSLSKQPQVIKTEKINVSSGPCTHMQPINVPGKGIQYIRLVTNPTTATTKTVNAKPQTVFTMPSKTLLLTDSKGNLIQMPGDKVISGQQPPPLVMTSTPTPINKLTSKPQQKLVRIAPISSKAQTITPVRSSQSLLAPLVREESPPRPIPPAPSVPPVPPAPSAIPSPPLTLEMESKSALRALIEETVADSPPSAHEQVQESVEVEFERVSEDAMAVNNLRNMEHDLSEYLSPKTDIPYSEEVELEGLRPRKACNCTKSQCLKLYCDCFANGEFCNRCNCTGCQNNLQNEELRQKAIRSCLERNPNAFRPKIGKSKSAGPETIRRHNKGCNCKRSGCLKNYCECYEAKIACTSKCKCVGCRNVEESVERARRRAAAAAGRPHHHHAPHHPPPPTLNNFLKPEVIDAVCQCMFAAASATCTNEATTAEVRAEEAGPSANSDPIEAVIVEFARCLQDIIGASQYTPVMMLADQVTREHTTRH